MRALAFDFRLDTMVYNIRDQYMFGPAFLVNPVTETMYTGKNAGNGIYSRNLYLPKAVRWYDFWTGQVYRGGQRISASAPISVIPLYVKAGSILPLGPVMEYATERKGDTLEIRIYAGADGSFQLYEDENDNYRYENGRFATIDFQWKDKEQQLFISGIRGNFEGMLHRRVFNIVLVNGTHGSGNRTTDQADKSIVYSGQALSLDFAIPGDP
jgi:alpha-D-xyloside xylohydrolase